MSILFFYSLNVYVCLNSKIIFFGIVKVIIRKVLKVKSELFFCKFILLNREMDGNILFVLV